MEDDAGWSLTESDPSVFTGLLQGLGVKGLQVEDLWSMDEDCLSQVGEIKAFVFLFKYVGGIEESSRAGTLESDVEGLYFANQVIQNACASLAILNAVFNLSPADVDIGSELENLKEFGVGMNSMDLGELLSNSDKLREVHNSFAKSDPFAIDPSLSSSKEKEDAFHFVSYLPALGSLYELDGLQKGPRSHGPVSEGAWLDRAREVINQRIASYPDGNLHFTLLAITKDPMPALQHKLAEAQAAGHEMVASDVLARIDDEERKRKRWEFENSLRRHNHISFAHQLLLALAKAGKLESAVEASRAKGKERREKDKERKGTAMEE